MNLTSTSPSRQRVRRLARRLRAAPGFTLTEILIAIALIVAVVALAVVELGGILVGNQEKVARIFVTETVETPLMSYYMASGSYPTNDQGLNALVNPPQGSGVKLPLMKELPMDPWNEPYQYQYPGQKNVGGRPDIWSKGPDRQTGTEDDIGNWRKDSN